MFKTFYTKEDPAWEEYGLCDQKGLPIFTLIHRHKGYQGRDGEAWRYLYGRTEGRVSDSTIGINSTYVSVFSPAYEVNKALVMGIWNALDMVYREAKQSEENHDAGRT